MFEIWNISVTSGWIFKKKLNLGLGNQNIIENCMQWKQPTMEDNVKVLKVGYLNFCEFVQ